MGSFGNIYDSIENLSTKREQRDSWSTKVHVSGGTGEVPFLLPNIESSTSKTLYWRSRIYNNSCYSYVADDSNTKCPSCEASMRKKVSFVDPPSATIPGSSLVMEGTWKEWLHTWLWMTWRWNPCPLFLVSLCLTSLMSSI